MSFTVPPMLMAVLQQFDDMSVLDRQVMLEVCKTVFGRGCLTCNMMSTISGWLKTHRLDPAHWKVLQCQRTHKERMRDGISDDYYCTRCGCDSQTAKGFAAHLAGKAHRKALLAGSQLRAYMLLYAALGGDEIDFSGATVGGEGQGGATARQDVMAGEGGVAPDGEVESVEEALLNVEMAAQARVFEANNRLLLDRDGQTVIMESSRVRGVGRVDEMNAAAGCARAPQMSESKAGPSEGRHGDGAGEDFGLAAVYEKLALAPTVSMEALAAVVGMGTGRMSAEEMSVVVEMGVRRLGMMQDVLRDGLAEVLASGGGRASDSSCGDAAP